jgi:hypothetical protein
MNMNRGAKALLYDGAAEAELAEPSIPTPAPGRVLRLGRVRVPIAGPYRPWATAYRMPDGRVVWCVRVWEVDHPQKRIVPTETLRTFCRINRLPRLLAEIAAIEGR